MSTGWVKLHRRVIEWGWYKKPFMFHLFSHLVLSANHEDKTWEGLVVKRGQVVCGRMSLSEETGISQQSIRTCLTRLEQTGEIVRKSTNKFTIITVCNYEEYQEKETSNQPAINQQSTSNQPAINHKQELKNDKNVKKNTNSRFSKPTVDEIAFYCQERNNGISPESFFDFYEAKGWVVGKSPMKCWKAAVRTWEKNNNQKGVDGWK